MPNLPRMLVRQVNSIMLQIVCLENSMQVILEFVRRNRVVERSFHKVELELWFLRQRAVFVSMQ